MAIQICGADIATVPPGTENKRNLWRAVEHVQRFDRWVLADQLNGLIATNGIFVPGLLEGTPPSNSIAVASFRVTGRSDPEIF
jgi:hypothetical protein